MIRKPIDFNLTQETPMETTLLVDGNFLLKKSYEGNPNTYGFNGKYIGCLYTFITILRKQVNELGIDKIVICWDGQNGGFRRFKINRNYKANRTSKSWYNKTTLSDAQIEHEKIKSSSLLAQKIRIQNYVEHLHIRQIELDEIEADDVIAHYVKYFSPNEKVIIYSNDRDYCQLLTYDNTSIFMDNLKVIIDRTNFKTHFPFSFHNALLVKALCGDVSDNLIGVKGLSDKNNAKTLLKNLPELIEDKQFSYDDLIENCKLDKNNKIHQKILETVKIVESNYLLMDLTNPFLNQEEKEEIEVVGESVMSSDGRSSTLLLQLINEDGFLMPYSSNFSRYVQPFFRVIVAEQTKYKKHLELLD